MKLQVDGKELDLKGSLKNFFGFNEFRGLQEDVIKSVLNKENTFVIMPTGGGKSLCRHPSPRHRAQMTRS